MKKIKYDMSKARKAGDLDEVTTKYIFRNISYPISKFLIYYTNIKPNTITTIGFLFAITSFIFFIQQNFLLGGIFAFIFLVFDNIDGDIARVKNLQSTLGKWWDFISGFLAYILATLGIVLGINTYLGYLFGTIALISYPIHTTILYFYKFEIEEKKDTMLESFKPSKRLSFFKRSYGQGLYFFLLLIFMIINKPLEFLILFAIVSNMFWILLLILQYKALRKQKL